MVTFTSGWLGGSHQGNPRAPGSVIWDAQPISEVSKRKANSAIVQLTFLHRMGGGGIMDDPIRCWPRYRLFTFSRPTPPQRRLPPGHQTRLRAAWISSQLIFVQPLGSFSWLNHIKKSRSQLVKVFGGRAQNTVRCPLGHNGRTVLVQQAGGSRESGVAIGL